MVGPKQSGPLQTFTAKKTIACFGIFGDLPTSTEFLIPK